MPADPDDLQRRLSLATPADTARGLTFNVMFDVVRELGGEALARRLDPQGTARRVEFFSYPVAEFLRIAWGAAAELEARAGGWEAVFRTLGTRTAVGVLGSLVGKTLSTIAGRSVRTLLANAPSGYKATVSYGERSVTFPTPTSAVFTFKGDFMHPAYHAGILGGGAAALGAREVRTGWRQTGPLDSTIEVEWT